MRRNPADKYADLEAHNKKVIARVTRIAAIIVAFLSTFFFFIKLLFM